MPISALAPPFKDIRKKEVERLAGQILFPVNVEGDRQYYLSIHAGVLLQPQVGAAGGRLGLMLLCVCVVMLLVWPSSCVSCVKGSAAHVCNLCRSKIVGYLMQSIQTCCVLSTSNQRAACCVAVCAYAGVYVSHARVI